MGFHSTTAAAGLGPSGLTQTSNAPGWTNIHRLINTEKVNGFESGSMGLNLGQPFPILKPYFKAMPTSAMLECLCHLPQQCFSVCYIYPSNASVFVIVQELCESRGGRPGLSVLTSLLVSVDVDLLHRASALVTTCP